MPKLIRLYIVQVLIGFALSGAFVTLLLWQNVGNLGHLVLTSDVGWLAVLMLFIFNGLVFAGVQFSITIMRMAEGDPPKDGGRRDPVVSEPAAVPAGIRGQR